MKITVLLEKNEELALRDICKTIDPCELVKCDCIDCGECPLNDLFTAYREAIEDIRDFLANTSNT